MQEDFPLFVCGLNESAFLPPEARQAARSEHVITHRDMKGHDCLLIDLFIYLLLPALVIRLPWETGPGPDPLYY